MTRMCTSGRLTFAIAVRGEPEATPLLSVVVPVFDEEESLPELHERLGRALAEVEGEVEGLYVDDGSRDGSAAILEGWAAAEPGVTLVQLSRNFGMEVAMSAGI